MHRHCFGSDVPGGIFILALCWLQEELVGFQSMLSYCTVIDTLQVTCLGTAGHLAFSQAKSISKGHFIIKVDVNLKEGVSSLLYKQGQEWGAMCRGENKKEKCYGTWLKNAHLSAKEQTCFSQAVIVDLNNILPLLCFCRGRNWHSNFWQLWENWSSSTPKGEVWSVMMPHTVPAVANSLNRKLQIYLNKEHTRLSLKLIVKIAFM